MIDLSRSCPLSNECARILYFNSVPMKIWFCSHHHFAMMSCRDSPWRHGVFHDESPWLFSEWRDWQDVFPAPAKGFSCNRNAFGSEPPIKRIRAPWPCLQAFTSQAIGRRTSQHLVFLLVATDDDTEAGSLAIGTDRKQAICFLCASDEGSNRVGLLPRKWHHRNWASCSLFCCPWWRRLEDGRHVQLYLQQLTSHRGLSSCSVLLCILRSIPERPPVIFSCFWTTTDFPERPSIFSCFGTAGGVPERPVVMFSCFETTGGVPERPAVIFSCIWTTGGVPERPVVMVFCLSFSWCPLQSWRHLWSFQWLTSFLFQRIRLHVSNSWRKYVICESECSLFFLAGDDLLSIQSVSVSVSVCAKYKCKCQRKCTY